MLVLSLVRFGFEFEYLYNKREINYYTTETTESLDG